jgi:hypothetical protein
MDQALYHLGKEKVSTSFPFAPVAARYCAIALIKVHHGLETQVVTMIHIKS